MPGKNLPRKTSIRGQRHMLAYITPDEAALLKSRGGTGELHKGIPSYPPGFGRERSGFGAERAGGAAGGKSGAAGRDTDRGRNRSGPRGARLEDADAAAAAREKQVDKQGGAQIREQIEAAKKAEAASAKKAQTQGLLERFLESITPGGSLNKVQNKAAQTMGAKFLDVLRSDEQAEVVRDTTGRVTGVRDKYGRLTGRDPAQERERQDREGGAEERRRRLAAATTPTTAPAPGAETPTLGKRVIRTDLAKESEAERARGRRLGRRSLLSRSTTLGV